MFLIVVPVILHGQSQEAKDSLISLMCKKITESTALNDTTRIINAYREHLYPFLDKFTDEKRNEIGKSIYLRMQMTCGSFKEILLRLEPPNKEFEKIIEKPTTFPDKKTCRDFISNRKYFYRDSPGDTVQLVIKDGHWIDKFKDGTYSKLKIHWMTDCEFELEFVASDNPVRSSFSKKGDRYKYYVI